MSKKHDLPAHPFYWGDWFKAMDLQSLPRETRCVWFEMLGRMWESNERGFLTINGKPMSDFAKANALGFGSATNEYLQHEAILREAGIFSVRESDGAMYSRKILNDIELSNIRAKAGSKGGKKTWDFAKANAKASAKAHSEDESEYEIKDETLSKIKNNQLNTFNELWSKYPRPLGKKQAFKHYCASVKTKEDCIAINTALENYIKEIETKKIEEQFIKHGSTWFNNWQDYLNQKEEAIRWNKL